MGHTDGAWHRRHRHPGEHRPKAPAGGARVRAGASVLGPRPDPPSLARGDSVRLRTPRPPPDSRPTPIPGTARRCGCSSALGSSGKASSVSAIFSLVRSRTRSSSASSDETGIPGCLNPRCGRLALLAAEPAAEVERLRPMTSSRAHLGDSHNFGRRVSLRGGRVAKPRTLLWEWLVLAADSPLRRLLDEAAERDGLGRDAFGFLPDLEFFPSRSAGLRRGGADRARAVARAFEADGRRALAAIVGRSLALWSWLGVTDLHWENLVLGVDGRGRVVFTPLDVEMILADLSLPTETKLLPDADPEYAEICRHACGVRRVLPYLGKPVEAADLLAMAGAYRGTLAFLDRQASAIADVFAGLPGLRETPIRVCLRGTGDYVHAGSEPLWPPLLDAEAEQLARGDIPYFFRLYGQPGIHYYGRPGAHASSKTTPARGRRPPARSDPPAVARPSLAVAEEAARGRAVHAARRLRPPVAHRSTPERRARADASRAHHRREAAHRRGAGIPAKPERLRGERLSALSLRRGPLGLRPARHRLRGRSRVGAPP